MDNDGLFSQLIRMLWVVRLVTRPYTGKICSKELFAQMGEYMTRRRAVRVRSVRPAALKGFVPR